jgi:phosphoglycerate dehydrogenase-like enzyme
MAKHRTVFLTQRGLQHQAWALAAAPAELDIAMRREAGRDEILGLLADAEFLITERAGVVDAGMIEAAPRMRLIQRLGIQTWDIDVEAARKAGVPVCYAPNGGCVMVAEHMVMQMLALLKRVRESMVVTAEAADWGKTPERGDEDHFAYNWSGRGGIGALAGATVGILGFGEIGLELAQRLKGFDCTVLYNKRSRFPAEVEQRFAIQYASQAEIAQQSDVVCCLLPYPGSEMAINAAYFAQMKQGSLFVHCGSGAVVNEEDLIAALQSNHLAGAALDTYTWEPLRPDDPLLALAREPASNLVLTPHVAAGGFTVTTRGRAGDYDNILAVLEGKPLRYRIV